MNKNTIVKLFAGLCLGVFVTIGFESSVAAWPYTFPSYAKLKVSRDPNSQSWLYLEFEWSKSCPPNFEKGKAVEFEFGIRPKCFLRPRGGMDIIDNCDKLMEEKKYNMPLNVIPKVGPNCYVDVWNYWIPPANQVVPLTEASCGKMSPKDQQCAIQAVNGNFFADKAANFAIGLHDASVLQSGIRYSIRYPVEVNNSPDCQNLAEYTDLVGSECVVFDANGNGIIHNDWGRAWVTMQTFKSTCDLPPFWCDDAVTQYTCPQIIGAVPFGVNQLGCVNADKHTDFWLNRLCVPTGDFEFTPGYGKMTNAVCTNENNSSDLLTHGICCVDRDNDKYYGNQGQIKLEGYQPQASTFGTRTGDCNDFDPNVNPEHIGLCADCKSWSYQLFQCPIFGVRWWICNANGHWEKSLDECMSILGPSDPFDPCPANKQCSPGSKSLMSCPNGVNFKSEICNANCVWETISDCLNTCPQGQTLCGASTCVDLVTDPKNCGACEHVCPASKPYCTPVGGCVECPGTLQKCPGTADCLDLNSNDQHCGGCGPGLACTSFEHCVNGICESSCPTNGQGQHWDICYVNGEAKCINIFGDSNHCGDCAKSCASNQECKLISGMPQCVQMS
jgi:hypothetical protein